MVLEQVSHPAKRQCPVAKASNKIVELLSEHWAIFAPGCECQHWVRIELTADDLSHIDLTSTTFQPFFLNFAKVHILATKFFLQQVNIFLSIDLITDSFIKGCGMKVGPLQVTLPMWSRWSAAS